MFDFIGREHCHTLTSSQGSILSPETPWCGKCRHGAIFLTRSAHFYGQPFPRSAPPHLSRDKIDRQLLTNLLSMFLYGTVMNLTDQFSSQLCMLILSDCNSALTVTKDSKVNEVLTGCVLRSVPLSTLWPPLLPAPSHTVEKTTLRSVWQLLTNPFEVSVPDVKSEAHFGLFYVNIMRPTITGQLTVSSRNEPHTFFDRCRYEQLIVIGCLSPNKVCQGIGAFRGPNHTSGDTI